jgi:hypothetical protein
MAAETLKLDPVKSLTAFAGDYEGEVTIQAEIFDEGETSEVALHVVEPNNPDPLTSLCLPPLEAIVLAERINATARAALSGAGQR